MAYTSPSGDQVDFDFTDALESPPVNFDFRIFDVIPVIMNNLILKGVIIR